MGISELLATSFSRTGYHTRTTGHDTGRISTDQFHGIVGVGLHDGVTVLSDVKVDRPGLKPLLNRAPDRFAFVGQAIPKIALERSARLLIVRRTSAEKKLSVQRLRL